MIYRIVWTKAAREHLQKIQINFRRIIVRKVDDLTTEPEKRGKSLRGELSGCFSLRISRYRVVYTIDKDRIIVLVIAVGPRKEREYDDIYKIAQRLFKSGIIE